MTALHLTFVLTRFSCTKEQIYSQRSLGEGSGNLLPCDYGVLSAFRVCVYQQNKTEVLVKG